MNGSMIRGLKAAFTSSLLTATGAETVHDTTVLLTYALDGVLYAKSGTNADQATPTTDYSTGAAFNTLTASQGCIIVWAYTSAGVVKCIQGDIEALDANGNFITNPEFPANIPNDVCPFAYQVLKAGSTAGTITFGSSNWNATGFTNAITNVSTLPVSL